MTLHTRHLAELLAAEAAVARERLGDRVVGLTVDGTIVRTLVTGSDGSGLWLCLDGAGFDAEPFAVSIRTAEGAIVPVGLWPPTMGAVAHPVTGEPMVCIQGCAEYYTHISHLKERWDAVRPTLRLAELLDHLLRKAGRA